MRVSTQRHRRAGDHDEARRQVADITACIVKKREEGRDTDHDDAEHQTAEHGETTHLICRFLRVGKISASEDVTHNDTDGFPHRDERNAHQVPDGGFDVDRGDGVEASVRIALVDDGHAECPESLITHERKCFYDKLTREFARNFEAGKRAADERELVCVCSCIDHQDRELHKTGDDGRDRGTDSAESRKPEHSVDQERVTDEVYDDRAKGGDHRDLGLAEIFQSAGICLCQTDRDQ